MTIDVEEGGSAKYDWDLVDETGAPVSLAAITSLKITLYDTTTDLVINSRTAQSILNVNGGTFHTTNGHGTMSFGPDDHPIKTATLKRETHVALFQATWAAGAKAKNWEVKIRVKNLNRIP